MLRSAFDFSVCGCVVVSMWVQLRRLFGDADPALIDEVRKSALRVTLPSFTRDAA